MTDAAAATSGALRGELQRVHQQASLLRAELASLRYQLSQIERERASMPADRLREADELVQRAAVRADTIASTAVNQLVPLLAPAPDAPIARLMRKSTEDSLPAGGLLADLREANEQLVLAALESQEHEAVAVGAHRRQVDFLARVAHELRNPLMPLRLATLMLDKARTDEQKYARLQATISGQVAQMTRLIGDLLEGARISTGEFRLERTQVDLVAVLARTIEAGRPAMEARGLQFDSKLGAAPVVVMGDIVRLMQVFGNLLQNACKYTPSGGRVSLSLLALGSTARVTVTDTGIGISAEGLPHVFDMFVRDTHAQSIDEGGLGIGLAVVRDLVRAHGGSVVVASGGVGAGCTFAVTLPVVASGARPDPLLGGAGRPDGPRSALRTLPHG